MEEQLISIKNNAMSLILDVTDPKELDGIKLQFLGRSGQLTLFLKEIASMPIQERPRMGKLANETKTIIEDTIQQKKQELQSVIQIVQKQSFDVTNPGIKPLLGHLHLITQAIEEITDIFEKVGFTKVRYPEVEWDWYAFTSLNFPKNHPARDDWETFFTTEDEHPEQGQMVLTPHTSSGQVREMQKAVEQSKKTKQPIDIKMLNIAKCYRRQSDISHTQMFHQFEGLVIGENISITHLKGVLDYFVKSYFGEKRVSRIRPYHFQFTEPSFEVDVSCGVCDGNGKINGETCRLCKAGWLEMGGSGMVHPNVLKYGGIDPKKYTGFAFGWGVERVLMMKEGIEIDDLRLLYSNKLEFLEQF
ncbi:MAG TPA: phenylalanine--tRNA ligase subunit alpha [Candidatus Saccharimonadales bacterium]|nr:phenylalanine--tRNA ligase subunit alpha [Candidatus Saccharimonadales bacterium]